VKLLLDTHAFLWAAMEPRLLSAKIRRRLEDPSTGIVVSAASAWEIATKFRLGKLPGAAAIVADYAAAVRGMQAQSLAIQDNHALRAGSLPQIHRDPFDRLLVAQAEIEELTLVSKDRALRQFGVELLW
jgi:PIN domain nuclease of toxin-antitoxin system